MEHDVEGKPLGDLIGRYVCNDRGELLRYTEAVLLLNLTASHAAPGDEWPIEFFVFKRPPLGAAADRGAVARNPVDSDPIF